MCKFKVVKAIELAEFVGGRLVGNLESEIKTISDITFAGPESLSFFEKDGPPPDNTAGCVLIREKSLPKAFDTSNCAFIVVENPKLSFVKAASLLISNERNFYGIDRLADISAEAEIGENVAVGPFASIASGAKIGRGCTIHAGVRIGNDVRLGEYCIVHPNVVILAAATIGNRVILHSGVVIGADGFGFVKDADGNYLKFPQIGSVEIGDDVEIGANTCIDRGALGNTVIGSGTKIDNLVQIGHNVRIGSRCVIAAETGISGSVIIEDDCVIGGQVGFGDHVYVQSGAVIGSQAGVLPGKIVRPGVWWGTPIRPLDEYKRLNAQLNGIGRLKEEVNRIKSILKEIIGHDKPSS